MLFKKDEWLRFACIILCYFCTANNCFVKEVFTKNNKRVVEITVVFIVFRRKCPCKLHLFKGESLCFTPHFF